MKKTNTTKTVKTFNTMEYNEKKEVTELFTTWLKKYTHEIIVKVLERRDEIINDEFSMKLLKELHERTLKEEEDFKRSMNHLLDNFDTFKEYDPHNHCLTHSKSYRDILYDMYISNY